MLLKGKPAAEAFLEKIGAFGLPKLRLAVFHPGGDASAESYLNAKKKLIERFGGELVVVSFPRDGAADHFWNLFDRVNGDRTIHGIMVETPFPTDISEKEVSSRIDPRKDVDGVSLVNQGLLYASREERLVPCTAMGAVILLEHYGVPVSGRRALVVGRSATVGLPLFKLLLNRNATVTVAHSRTADLEKLVGAFDIVVVATGRAGIIQSSRITDGATVVDIGINVASDGSLCGDLAVEAANEADRINYSPVPGGAGVVTNAVLLHNLWQCYQLQQEG